MAYYRGAVRYLRDTPLTRLRVAVDGRIVADDAALVTVANVETYGAWLTLTPGASPVDGLFDVFVMRGATKLEVLAKLLRRHLRLPAAEQGSLLCRGRHVSVVTSGSTRDELEVMPGLLPVVVSMEMATRLARESLPATRPLGNGVLKTALTGTFGTAPFFRIAGVALAAMSGAIGVAIGLLP